MSSLHRRSIRFVPGARKARPFHVVACDSESDLTCCHRSLPCQANPSAITILAATVDPTPGPHRTESNIIRFVSGRSWPDGGHCPVLPPSQLFDRAPAWSGGRDRQAVCLEAIGVTANSSGRVIMSGVCLLRCSGQRAHPTISTRARCLSRPQRAFWLRAMPVATFFLASLPGRC